VTDARGVLDYAELVHRAVLLAETPEVREQLRAAYRVVFVDEYQDTDPAQVRLLEALAGAGRELVVVGDPDQSIYAFRGADLHGILEFPERFRTNEGEPAPIAVLRTSRRSGPTLLGASRRVARRMPLTRLPAEKVRAHRELSPAQDGPAEGLGQRVDVPVGLRGAGRARRSAAPRSSGGRRRLGRDGRADPHRRPAQRDSQSTVRGQRPGRGAR